MDEIVEPAAGEAVPADVVTLPRAELDAMLKAATAAPAAYEQELSRRDRRIAELEAACKAAVRDRELAAALAGRPLVPGAAAQLVTLWRDEFDAYEDGGRFRVSARDGRSVAEAVGERLAAPEYAHFCLPASRGGTGGASARDASRPAAAPPAPAPRNLGEAVVMRWRQEAASRPNTPPGSIGLRRPR